MESENLRVEGGKSAVCKARRGNWDQFGRETVYGEGSNANTLAFQFG